MAVEWQAVPPGSDLKAMTDSAIGSGASPNQLLTLADPKVVSLETEAAGKFDVTLRDLRPRVRLHLPRIADAAGRMEASRLASEIYRCAAILGDDYTAVEALRPRTSRPVTQLEFRRLEPKMANPIFEHLHYLRSARPGAENFGLVDPEHGLALCLCSVNTIDWSKLARQLSRVAAGREPVKEDAIRDVARVYSFDTAPKYSISRLLAQVRAQLRAEVPAARLLTTVVDPNLDFDGRSYRAAGWTQWATVRARPYLYVDRQYTSPRQLRALYGTSHPVELREKLGARFTMSRIRLADSIVFCSRTRGKTEDGPDGRVVRMHR